jgi:hypothetical protein
MATSTLEELKGQIAAGEYAIDSGAVAGKILSTFAVIRRVGHGLMSEDAQDTGDTEDAAGDAGRRPQPRARRGSRPASSDPLQPRGDRNQGPAR